MLTASAPLIDLLNNGHVVKTLPRLIAEWNQNRYAGITTVDNTPSDASNNPNLAEFPITSIVESQRPETSGSVKARTAPDSAYGTGQWTRTRVVNGEHGYTTEDYSDIPTDNRYYTVGEDSTYKYWSSPGKTSVTNNGQGYPFAVGEEVAPYIIYTNDARTNKIVITFESIWAIPQDHDIQITTNGTTWTTIASDTAPDADGRIILYRQSGGSWTSTVNRDNSTLIRGVRMLVRTLNKPEAHFQLIEMSARLEVDLSPYVISWSAGLTLSDINFITPLGKASSNEASISLYNGDGLFNNENPASPYYKIIDANVKMTLDLIYDLTDWGGTTETIRQFTMYVDNWGSQQSEEAEVSLKDSSKFFQENPLPRLFLENVTVGEAVWRICDSVGFTRYAYNKVADDITTSIPYFWTAEDSTIWENISQIAEATQTAIYFDEYDVLQIKTRNAAFDSNAPVTWEFEATDDNGKLADIVESDDDFNFESNVVNVKYNNTHVSEMVNGIPELQAVWQPEGDFVLRASPLTAALTTTSDTFRIAPADAVVWPYEGTVNIEGELIRYAEKQYKYYDKNSAIQYVWLKNKEDKDRIDKQLSSEYMSYLNTFTGWFKVVERGYLWSYPRAHTVDVTGYTVRRTASGSATDSGALGAWVLNSNLGTARVVTNSTYLPGQYVLVRRGNTGDPAPKFYGTRFRVDKAATGNGEGAFGLHLSSGTGGVGYYIEVNRTSLLDANAGAIRARHHEINFYVKYPSGATKRIGPENGKGVPFVIVEDKWYDLEVEFTRNATNHFISIWLDGNVVLRITLAGTDRQTVYGRWGVFQRGRQTTDLDYLASIEADAVSMEFDRPDDVSMWDYIHGGYRSNQFSWEYVYGMRYDYYRRTGTKSLSYRTAYNKYFIDEFGPIVHEVREMNVDFSKYPVVHSNLYITNTAQVVVPWYNATPFGAKFMIANSTRRNAVVNGDDDATFGADSSVNQKMFIYGRVLIQDEEAVETARNEDRIRRVGEVKVDFSTKWIQSKDSARALADWISQHWADGTENLTITTFGNPLVQIGDLVTVDYPEKHIFRETHRYFVTKVSRNWDNGLDTEFTLRRTS